jgi:tRNA nucleotidyltransferase/poly(A) polymerase
MKTASGARKLEQAVRTFAVRNAGTAIFLVGGAVRDRMLGRRTTDFDFAMPAGEEELARHLEGQGFGRAVRISSNASPFPVWRLARPGLTVDIARFENAETIERDLARRDFTINALAREVTSGRLVDPCGGEADLGRRRVRMVSSRNLDADPIRILRAYRLAAALGWSIEERTRAALRRRASRLAGEAKERVHAEIVRLFSAPSPSRAIGWAEQDGVLAASLGLPRRRGRFVARVLARFDAVRRPERERFLFRMAVVLFRLGVRGERVPEVLGVKGFSRQESSIIALEVRFLEAAFSRAPAERVLFDFREHWAPMRALLRLAAHGPSESVRSRRLLSTARRCRFVPAPVDGRDIARWLAIPPGAKLGQALERARFLHFTGRLRTRKEIENAVATFDRVQGVE